MHWVMGKQAMKHEAQNTVVSNVEKFHANYQVMQINFTLQAHFQTFSKHKKSGKASIACI